MTWMEFTISVLAVFRLSTMFAKESGPMKIFQKLRNTPSKSTPAGKSAREGLGCPLCLSIWWSAIVTLFLWFEGRIAPLWTILWWLAISGGAVAMAALHPKIEQ